MLPVDMCWAVRDVRNAAAEAAASVAAQAAAQAAPEDLMFSMSYGTTSSLSDNEALAASLTQQLVQDQVRSVHSVGKSHSSGQTTAAAAMSMLSYIEHSNPNPPAV